MIAVEGEYFFGIKLSLFSSFWTELCNVVAPFLYSHAFCEALDTPTTMNNSILEGW